MHHCARRTLNENYKASPSLQRGNVTKPNFKGMHELDVAGHEALLLAPESWRVVAKLVVGD